MSSYNILAGDCINGLPTLAPSIVQTIITSPPYWGLRDYGIAPTEWPEISYAPMAGLPALVIPAMTCCLGLEATPEAFIGHLLHVFRLAAPALRKDGTAWVNLGDTYSGSRCGGNTGIIQGKQSGRGRAESVGARKQVLQAQTESRRRDRTAVPRSDVQVGGLQAKNLVGIPWRFALAMQADGWILRQDIIWHKPNPMPESTVDRCTKAHEYIFLFSKSKQYYFDHKAIAEPLASSSVARLAQDLEQQEGSARAYGGGAKLMKAVKRTSGNLERKPRPDAPESQVGNQMGSVPWVDADDLRNKRSVWSVATKPYSEAHFAVFPPALIEPCILAGSRPGDVVLDMFSGSGTTGQEALRHGRAYIGMEAKPENVKLHHKRMRGLQYQLLPTTP
ncbi:site-specific DNA-methyltransferase [Hymenobacter aerilatus]|uniref:Methyltransferase n=1 Tax=Hymenobacter aerilatus TaxID=2932251 RepID=A0A8T9SZ99_9BACT|nr:site-specific DNA-methyltransferase [Hymenobacter aerilatus]UOR06264.1 site-specific DNA-methyltransferase [Hymenobacter aerilatus]